MRAVVSVIGKDRVGILAKVATACASCNASVIEVNQSVMQEMFAMVMLVDIQSLNVGFDDFVSAVEAVGSELSLSAHVMHEDIFNSMHRI
ncbi:MAG: ACT domain-containing protein [Angelakisella sp.]